MPVKVRENVCQLLKEFYREFLDEKDYIVDRQRELKRKAGLEAKDKRVVKFSFLDVKRLKGKLDHAQIGERDVEGQRNFDFVAAYLASFAHMLPGKKEVEVVLTLLSAEYNLNPHFRDDWEHEVWARVEGGLQRTLAQYCMTRFQRNPGARRNHDKINELKDIIRAVLQEHGQLDGDGKKLASKGPPRRDSSKESMKSESQSVTCTELEAEAHDDDDVYHACGHEQPEEEVLTEDDFVDVETHNDNMGAGVGETMDTADTQPLETQLQDSQPQDSQALDTQPMEGIGGDELNSEDEKKGARKDEKPLLALPEEDEHLERRAAAVSEMLQKDSKNEDMLEAQKAVRRALKHKDVGDEEEAEDADREYKDALSDEGGEGKPRRGRGRARGRGRGRSRGKTLENTEKNKKSAPSKPNAKPGTALKRPSACQDDDDDDDDDDTPPPPKSKAAKKKEDPKDIEENPKVQKNLEDVKSIAARDQSLVLADEEALRTKTCFTVKPPDSAYDVSKQPATIGVLFKRGGFYVGPVSGSTVKAVNRVYGLSLKVDKTQKRGVGIYWGKCGGPDTSWEVAKKIARWVEVDYQDGHGTPEDDDDSEQESENDID